MPLKAIKGLLELEGEATRISAAELKRRYGVPQEVLDRLAELEVITPNSRGYGVSDVRIVEAISRFRAGGYDERIGFTVYDTLRYKRAMEELVKEEVEVIMDRLGGEVDADRAARADREGRRAAAGPHLRAAHQGARRRAQAAARRARVIRRARPEDVPGIAEAMGAAFEDDPIASWFWNKPTRPARVHHRAGTSSSPASTTSSTARSSSPRRTARSRAARCGRRPASWRFPPRVEVRTTRYVVPRLGFRVPIASIAMRRIERKHPTLAPLVPVGARRPAAEPGAGLRLEADVRDARALRPRAHAGVSRILDGAQPGAVRAPRLSHDRGDPDAARRPAAMADVGEGHRTTTPRAPPSRRSPRRGAAHRAARPRRSRTAGGSSCA